MHAHLIQRIRSSDNFLQIILQERSVMPNLDGTITVSMSLSYRIRHTYDDLSFQASKYTYP